MTGFASRFLFVDRAEAGRLLAARLRHLADRSPLVLGIPRGGVAVAAEVARELGADLDVILSRKLRAPWQPELALGAICEGGEVHLDEGVAAGGGVAGRVIEEEIRVQTEEIERRRELFRRVKPRADPNGRTVILVDDGLATGSTMLAALRTLRAERPARLVVGLPVAPADRLEEVRRIADEVVCLAAPADFLAVGEFYRHFGQVSDDRVCRLLEESWERGADAGAATTGASPAARPQAAPDVSP
jgi:putative phosphoribosyl transferase